ncbi:hypothetical protein L2E82_50161 [Cichorium intybus]|nr:hypothetical protein L2E82_50161 [Cichorium intybus]
MGNYSVCWFFTRKFKISDAEPPTDVKEAFKKYSGDGIQMTADQLRRFLKEYQCDDSHDASISKAERIVEQTLHKRHHLAKLINRKALSLEDFYHFLFSTDLNPPIKSQVHQDMTAPLSHYFIYTGHNSYLTGNQLSSKCSEAPIIRALKREKLDELPTPESLKYRILISTKPPKEYLEAEEDIQSSSGLKSRVSDDSDDLIAIHAGKPKGGLKDALKVEKDKVRRLSLVEQALEKAVENHGHDVVRFSQKNILRIYPKGTRITSSNYKPLIGWLHGAQMVAFNMQGYGRSLWLMHGMFRANGGCGYVKKPDFLLRHGPKDEMFNRKAKLPAKTSLKVNIYMGDGWHLDFKKTHFDKYSPPDFYTRIGIAGAPVDKKMKRTKIKEDNWTPVWNEEFIFPLAVPELALLRIEVHVVYEREATHLCAICYLGSKRGADACAS